MKAIDGDYVKKILTQGKERIFEEERSLYNFKNLFQKLQSTSRSDLTHRPKATDSTE